MTLIQIEERLRAAAAFSPFSSFYRHIYSVRCLAKIKSKIEFKSAGT